MTSPVETKTTRSIAVKASWLSLGLAIGCVCTFVVFEMVDEMTGFAHNRQGVRTRPLPRAAQLIMWAGTGAAVVAAVGSFLLIRRLDHTFKAIIGIMARSLIGIGVGLCACLVLWLYVGHRVFGS